MSGRASVNITLPNNTTSSTKSYGLYLIASGARGGTSATRRLVVVEHAPTRAAVAPVITTQPAGQTVAGGGYARFIAAASGNPTPSVQWQVFTGGASTWANIAGATDTSYSVTANTSDNGDEYRAMFTNAAGSATTNAATLTVSVAPVITTQPTSQTVATDQLGTFTAASSGNPTPSVQWQVSTHGGSTWVNIAGATATSYSVTANTSDNGDEYRAMFTNAAGSATTNAATLTAFYASTSASGYSMTASGARFSAVSADWTVPTVTCPPGGNTEAAQWPGIEDYFDTVVQDGTQEICDSSGTPEYYAWCELYGDGSPVGPPCSVPQSSYPVSPGDAIAAAVSLSGATWTLSLTDTTKGWTFTFTTPNTLSGLNQTPSAEIILENPVSVNGPQWGLANFGAIDFTGATAEVDGKTLPITAFSPLALQMTNGSTLLAAAGPLDPEGDFTDTWYAAN